LPLPNILPVPPPVAVPPPAPNIPSVGSAGNGHAGPSTGQGTSSQGGNSGQNSNSKGKEPIRNHNNDNQHQSQSPSPAQPSQGQPGFPGHDNGTPGPKQATDPSPGSINDLMNQSKDYARGSQLDKKIYDDLPSKYTEAEKQDAVKLINEAAEKLIEKGYKPKRERGTVESVVQGEEGAADSPSYKGRERDHRNNGNHGPYKDPYKEGGPKDVSERFPDLANERPIQNRDLGQCAEGAAITDYM
jgi:hypothetical protein